MPMVIGPLGDRPFVPVDELLHAVSVRAAAVDAAVIARIHLRVAFP
jgi:hypothetical protein